MYLGSLGAYKWYPVYPPQSGATQRPGSWRLHGCCFFEPLFFSGLTLSCSIFVKVDKLRQVAMRVSDSLVSYDEGEA